jgi:hypothetical protein
MKFGRFDILASIVMIAIAFTNASIKQLLNKQLLIPNFGLFIPMVAFTFLKLMA